MTGGREVGGGASATRRQYGRLRPTLVTVLVGGTCALLLATVPRSVASDERTAQQRAESLAVTVVSGLVDRSPARAAVRCVHASSQPAYGIRPLAVAAFEDPRLGEVTAQGRVSTGGVVEVLSTPDRARQRRAELADQIHTAQRLGYDEGGRSLDEHLVVEGRVVLRLADRFDRRQVRAYTELLRSLLGSPSDTVHPTAMEVVRCST